MTGSKDPEVVQMATDHYNEHKEQALAKQARFYADLVETLFADVTDLESRHTRS